MTSVERLRSLLTRFGPSVAAAGAALLLVQNALILAGLASIASGFDPGGRLIPFSLYLDIPGLTLVALGLFSLLSHDAVKQGEALQKRKAVRFGVASGVLCLAWVVLTVAWRIVGMGGVWRAVDTASSVSPDSQEFSIVMSSLFTQVQVVMSVWIAASVCLALASLLFALFLRALSEGKQGSAAWPFFCLLNAAATTFLAAVFISMTGGEVDFSVLITAAFVKLVTVPLFGVIGYFSLAGKMLKAPRALSEETSEVRTQPAAGDEVSPATDAQDPKRDD